MKKNRKQADEELNFWQPASDMFSALMLVLMLVILLLGLYLVHIPEHNQLDPWAGNTFAEGSDDWTESTATPSLTPFLWIPAGWNGGGEETPRPTGEATPTVTLSPTPTVSPTPDLEGGGAAGGGGGEGGGEGAGEGPGDEPDMGLKSAVYVMVVDAETNRTIKQPLVEFELYGVNHALQILNTYYPERVTFRTYETTENGTFYFPEKLALGVYELHELTEPEGYDASDNIEFILAEIYDWSDPFVVRVPVYPSQNVIRVRMVDEETDLPVAGGTFDVVANEDIITSDGTLRYSEGQVVGEIVCDEEGYGVSGEVHLGSYRLRQRDIPTYYVAMDEEIEVTVDKKTKIAPPLQTITSRRTRINLMLTDELYPERGIANAEFRLTADNGTADLELRTDNEGRLTADTLEKGTTYRIQQISAPGDYLMEHESRRVSVSNDGRIQGEPETEISLHNHMIRVAIGLTEEFSSVQVPDVNLALYDSDGVMIRTWTTSGSPQMFTNLKEGSYTLVKEGDVENAYTIFVNNQVKMQNINLHTTYLLRYVVFGGVASILLVLATFIGVFVKKVKRKK